MSLDTLRDMPVEAVMIELGCVPDGREPGKWRGPNREVLMVKGDKVFNHATRSGGGGAIDAVITVTGWQFGKATAWLRKLAKSGQVSPVVKVEGNNQNSEPTEMRMPEADPSCWPSVRAYLLVRGINPVFADALHKSGDVYAEKRARGTVNVVFVRRDLDRAPVGAVCRGIRGSYKQTIGRKADGCFAIGCLEMPSCIAIVESPIDAISYYQLWHFPGLLVLSTDGDGNPYQDIIDMTPDCRITLAQDSDESGDDQATRIANILVDRDWTRHRTVGAKDWNEFLITTLRHTTSLDKS